MAADAAIERDNEREKLIDDAVSRINSSLENIRHSEVVFGNVRAGDLGIVLCALSRKQVTDSAPAPDGEKFALIGEGENAEAWFPWSEGFCPVDPEETIRVRFNSGRHSNPAPAGNFHWGVGPHLSQGGYQIDRIGVKLSNAALVRQLAGVTGFKLPDEVAARRIVAGAH